MAAQARSEQGSLRHFPAPPDGFTPFATSARELTRHGLPQRPDPRERPGLAALWDACAQRYVDFEHRVPQLGAGAAGPGLHAAALSPVENCGYSLTTSSAQPFTAFFVHWTVPDLVYTDAPLGLNRFHTFVEIGFHADVHVNMSVDAAQHVTCEVAVSGVPVTNLPVAPGDAMSAVLCISSKATSSTVFHGVANETRGVTVNATADLGGLPPAVSVDAGITLDLVDNNPTLNRLPRFGVVYFDEISAYTTTGNHSLTAGTRVNLTDLHGATIASAYPLNDTAFKVVHG